MENMIFKEYENKELDVEKGFEFYWGDEETTYGIEFTGYENPANIKRFIQDVQDLIHYNKY